MSWPTCLAERCTAGELSGRIQATGSVVRPRHRTSDSKRCAVACVRLAQALAHCPVLYVNVQFVMPTISASTARETLPAQLDRVERGEEVAITRHGRVVAVLVSPDVLRSRRASGVWNDADRIDERLQTARSEPLRTPVLDPDRADELVKEVRRGRSGR